MMMPQILPVSDIRKRWPAVLAEAAKRPVILTQHGKGVAVLLSLAQWESLLERFEDLDDAITALEARLTDTEPPVPLENVLADLELGIRDEAISV